MAYQIILYLHVASALGFFLFHGATASATFGLKREQGRESVELLLQMRETAGLAGGGGISFNDRDVDQRRRFGLHGSFLE